MNTTFLFNYGAGATIATIPALEKFQKLNPNDDFKIILYKWSELFWNHPTLQSKVFDITQKGIFDSIVKNNKICNPEPYHVNGYYNNELHLIEAFDEQINNTNDHSDLGRPSLYLSNYELSSIKGLIESELQKQKKDKFIVFQPYGSGLAMVNGRPLDRSARSIDVDDYLYMVNKLSKHAVVFFFGEDGFRHPGDQVTPDLRTWQKDLRLYMSLIHEANFFLGCDSIGQHIAYAFNKPGAVVLGATFDKNVSYPDHFKIFRNGEKPTYDPIRIAPLDSELSNKLNERTMKFTTKQLDEICDYVIKSL